MATVYSSAPADVDTLGGLHGGGQLRFALRLGLAQDIFDDALAGFGVVASGVAALPATIAAFADVTFTVGAFLGHGINSFAFVSQHTYHKATQIATTFLKKEALLN